MRIYPRSALLALLLVPAIAGSAIAQTTADQVIEKHLAALGGREALAKITTRRSTGTVTVTTPGGDITGPVETTSKAPNKLRVYVQLDLSPMGMNEKMIIEQKFDGTAGWSMNSMQGDQPVSGNQLDNMKNNMFPSPLLKYKENGVKAELLPREDVGGKSAYVLLFTPPQGSPIRMYFDPDTFLVSRVKTTVNSPEMGGDVEQIQDVSDYRTVDGIKVPFQTVNTNAMQSIKITLTKVEQNVPIDDAIFSAKAPTSEGQRSKVKGQR